MLKVQTTWRIQVTAPELHHGFTTQGQPWRLGHVLGHLLGNSRTCGGRRLPSRCFSFISVALWWLDRCGGRWRQRQQIEEHIGQRASRTGPETGQVGRPGPTGPGPVRPRLAPKRFFVNCGDASLSIVDLLPYACGPLMLSSPRFR
jgi:hypothetical protein